MKHFIFKNKKASVGIAVCLLTCSIILMSFQDTPYVNQILNERQMHKDTFPEKLRNSSIKMKDFDKLVENMNKNMFTIGDEMNSLNLELLQNQAALSLKQIDVEKILKEVEVSLKDINVEKIMTELTASLKDINQAELEGRMQTALQEAKQGMEKAKQELSAVNTEEIKKQLGKARREIKNLDAQDIKKEMENAREEIERSKAEIGKIDMKKIMAEAGESVEKARHGLKQLKAMFNEMEQDGLINSKDGFSIEYKNRELFINGVKQKESVTDKYRKYMTDDHFEITIEKD